MPVVAPADCPAVVTPSMSGMPGMAATPSSTATAATATAAPASHAPYDATLPPVGAGTDHKYTIRLKDETLEIAPGVRYQGWTFDGRRPAP